jgi:hypothetical protein
MAQTINDARVAVTTRDDGSNSNPPPVSSPDTPQFRVLQATIHQVYERCV